MPVIGDAAGRGPKYHSWPGEMKDCDLPSSRDTGDGQERRRGYGLKPQSKRTAGTVSAMQYTLHYTQIGAARPSGGRSCGEHGPC